MTTLKNWSVAHSDPICLNSFQEISLMGNVYGHPRIADGTNVLTSAIRNARVVDGKIFVKTYNTEYVLQEDDVCAEYNQLFPNAYAQYANEITLPMHTLLTDEDAEYVAYSFVQNAREFYNI